MHRSVYSDMPSFLSQSAICCIAAIKVQSGPDRVFHHGNREFTPNKCAIAPLEGDFRLTQPPISEGRKEMNALPPFGGKKNKLRHL